MTLMVDTPQGIAFVRAAARKSALSLEVKGLRVSRGRTAYSIVKDVYGFRGSRQSVLADLTEYIEAELRLKALTDEQFAQVQSVVEDVYNALGDRLTQQAFESFIAWGEANGAISNGIRQGASDFFYVSIVRQNAGNR